MAHGRVETFSFNKGGQTIVLFTSGGYHVQISGRVWDIFFSVLCEVALLLWETFMEAGNEPSWMLCCERRGFEGDGVWEIPSGSLGCSVLVLVLAKESRPEFIRDALWLGME